MPIVRPDGCQSITRAVELLSAVAARAAQGARLSDTAEATGLHIATARRIMQGLVAEGLLAFDSNTKLYTIGPTIFSVAVRGNTWFSRRELFIPALEAVAQRTSDTAMLSIRSGHEAVCLERCEGAFPIRVMSLEKGSRRPLGAGAGSMAILAFLREDERQEILRRCSSQYPEFGLSANVITDGITEARRHGFSFNPGRIIEGVFGIGVPVLVGGTAVAAISVAAIADRMTKTRREEIVGIIGEELASIAGIEVPTAATGRKKAWGKVA